MNRVSVNRVSVNRVSVNRVSVNRGGPINDIMLFSKLSTFVSHIMINNSDELLAQNLQ